MVCQAPGKKDKVKRITVFLAGSQASLGSAGIDANKTSLMKGDGGHFNNVGKVSQQNIQV